MYLLMFNIFLFFVLVVFLIKYNKISDKELEKLQIEGRINCIKGAIADGHIIHPEEAYQTYRSGNGSINFRIKEPYSKMLLFYDYPNITKYFERIDTGMDISFHFVTKTNINSNKFRNEYPDISLKDFYGDKNGYMYLVTTTIGNKIENKLIETEIFDKQIKNKEIITSRYYSPQPKLIVDENNHLVSLEDFQKQYPDVKVVIDRTIWAMST